MDASPTSSSGAMLKQVEHIWKMLDQLADTDPEGYNSFVQGSMNDSKKEVAIPQPYFCTETQIVSSPSQGCPLFVNVCGWTRVPGPKNASDAVSVTGGPLEDLAPGTSKVTMVAINPDVLKECLLRSEDMNLLIKLIFKFLENQHKLHLSKRHTVLKETYVGDKSELNNFFTEKKKIGENNQTTDELKKFSPEDLLAKMGRVKMEEEKIPEVSFGKELNSGKLNGRILIEEISSVDVVLSKPEYDLVFREQDERKGRRMVVRVALPGVSSVVECDLEIANREINLYVEGKYKLDLKLPEEFKEEAVTAKFIKKTSTLSITLPTKDR